MNDTDVNQLRIDLLSNLLLFNRVFFEKMTGREFMMSHPVGSESHFITVCRELTDILLLKTNRLLMNLPPGWAKSQLCKSFVAWAMAHYPDSKFLYISHSADLAAKHTHAIKKMMCLPLYKTLFNVEIRRDSSAKDFFQTEQGGVVAAFGSKGAITGHDGGMPGLDRFSGCVLIDDVHKPDEVHSDTTRESVKRNYFETIERRLRAPNVPLILLGQRLHEDDLPAHILNGADGKPWKKVIIKALDDAGNARYPEVNPKDQLLLMQETQPYVFASQFQQDPMPSGGALFKEDWFPLLTDEPKIISTFVTADSAETEKEYNDATVFSFWGIYKLDFKGREIDELYALHWIDCVELRVDPKDLESEFLDFYAGCMRHKVKPRFAAIEKKSTGVTLISTLKTVQGLKIIDIERSGAKNNKTERFLAMQPFISNKQISLPTYGKHTKMCIEHMKKITANDTHRFDDIADTCYDAIKMGLIDKVIINRVDTANHQVIAKNIMNSHNKLDNLRKRAYGR